MELSQWKLTFRAFSDDVRYVTTLVSQTYWDTIIVCMLPLSKSRTPPLVFTFLLPICCINGFYALSQLRVTVCMLLKMAR